MLVAHVSIELLGMVQNNMMRQQMTKKDSVADAVNSSAKSFREYVQSKIKDILRPTCQEIHSVVSQVFGISRSQIMWAVKRFMKGNPDEFLMLKELPKDEKLEWVLLCLAE
ncbi:Hut operon positive regulatory protein [Bienertia sinuspersici]